MNTKLKLKIIEKYGSQAEFSTIVGEDESLVSRIVRERRTIDFNRQKKWADALGCKTEDIFVAGN